MDDRELTGKLEIESLGLYWKCPSCDDYSYNADMFPFDQPTMCESCGKRWQSCPNDDCYGNDDCPTCGGNSGGLVEVHA